MVPEIEERHAARYGGYTWREWRELDRPGRIDGVAVYRIDRLVDLHSNDAVQEHSEQRRRTSERRSRAASRR